MRKSRKRPLTKHEDDIRRGIRKGPMPPPSRPHRDKMRRVLDKIAKALKEIGLDD